MGKAEKEQAKYTFQQASEEVKKSPVMGELKDIVFGTAREDAESRIDYRFMAECNYRMIVGLAEVTWSFPFGRLRVFSRRGQTVSMAEDVCTEAWKPHIVYAMRETAKYLSVFGKQYTQSNQAADTVDSIILSHDNAKMDNAAYTVEELISATQRHIQDYFARQYQQWEFATEGEHTSIEGLNLYRRAYELPKIELRVNLKEEENKAKKYYGLSFRGKCTIGSKNSHEEISKEFGVSLSNRELFDMPWNLDDAAEKMCEIIQADIDAVVHRMENLLDLRESAIYKASDLIVPQPLSQTLMEFGKAKNVEPKMPFLKPNTSDLSFVGGDYCYAMSKSGSLNLCKIKQSGAPTVVCFSYPSERKYNPRNAFPVYQEDVPVFAAFFQKILNSMKRELNRPSLGQQKFTVELVNLLNEEGNPIGLEYPQTSCFARIRVCVFKAEKGKFVSAATILYDCRNQSAYNTEDFVRKAILSCVGKEEVFSLRADLVKKAVYELYDACTFPQKAILYYLAQDGWTHSVSQITAGVKALWKDISIKDDAIDDAFDALLGAKISVLSKSYQLIIMKRVTSYYKNFNAFGLGHVCFGDGLDFPEPIAAVSDCQYLTTKSKGVLLKRYATSATTDAERWEVLNALVEIDSKTELYRFLDSDEGKKFKTALSDDDRMYARLRLEQTGKYGKDVLSRLEA